MLQALCIFFPKIPKSVTMCMVLASMPITRCLQQVVYVAIRSPVCYWHHHAKSRRGENVVDNVITVGFWQRKGCVYVSWLTEVICRLSGWIALCIQQPCCDSLMSTLVEGRWSNLDKNQQNSQGLTDLSCALAW